MPLRGSHEYHAYKTYQQYVLAKQLDYEQSIGQFTHSELKEMFPPLPSFQEYWKQEKAKRNYIKPMNHGPARKPCTLSGCHQLVSTEETNIICNAMIKDPMNAMKSKRVPKISKEMVWQKARADPNFLQVWGDILEKKDGDADKAVNSIRSILRSAILPRRHKHRL